MATQQARIEIVGDNKTRSAFAQVERDFGELEKTAGRLKPMLGALAAGFSARGVVQMADDYAGLQARLKLASRDMREFAAANQAVERIAAASQAPLLETATLYTRIAQSLKDTSVSQAEFVDTTEAVALSLRISGASAAESSSAMLQFSQAIASGVLRGEEFNAVNESAPRLLQALAKSLGVNTGQLREMAKQGQLTREVLIDGLGRQLPILRREAEALPKTFSAGFTELQNTLLKTIGQINEMSGAGRSLADVMVQVGNPAIVTTFQALGVVGANVAYVFRQIGIEIGGIAAQFASVKGTGLRAEDWKGFTAIGDAMKRDAAAARAELDKLEKKILGLSGQGGGGASGAGVAARTALAATLPTATVRAKRPTAKDLDIIDPFGSQRRAAEADALRKQVDAQNEAFDRLESMRDYQIAQDEQAAAALGRLRDQYRDMIDPLQKYREQLEEVRGLADAGLIDADQALEAEFAIQQQIDAVAGLGKEIDKTKDFAEDFGLTFNSALEDAMVNGKRFSDVLKSLEQDIARIIIRKSVTEPLGNAVSEIFKGIDFGKLFSFGGGRAAGGPVYPGQYYVVGERGPEVLLPRTAGTVVPAGAGGGPQIIQYIKIDSRSDLASIQSAMNFAKDTAKAEILASMQRGGIFARATGRA